MTERVVVASANPDKVAEIAAILGDQVDLVPRPIDLPDVVEDGETLEDNARLKAAAVCVATGAPAVADDTGLEVDALDGAPGVHSARFAGDDAAYADNVTLLLDRLSGVPGPQRTARFRTVALLRHPDGREVVAEGVVDGHIADQPRGASGFGYDPVFVPGEIGGPTFAEMTAVDKHAISHRGEAFRALAAAVESDERQPRLQRLRGWVLSTWDGAVRIAPGLDLLGGLVSAYGSRNGSVLIGHVAYRLFMWMIPLLVVVIGLLGYGASEGIDIVRYGQEAGFDEEMVAAAGEDVGSSGLTVAIAALIALLWATRSLVRALYFVFAQAWAVAPTEPDRPAVAVGLTLVGAIVAVAVTSALNVLAGQGPVLLVSTSLASAGAMGAVLLVVSRLLPNRARSILSLIPGAAFATFGIVCITVFGGLYFPQRFEDASQTYGTMGFTLVFLFFLWLWAALLVGSALINSIWCDRESILDGRPYVAAPELVPHWLRRMLPASMQGDGAGERIRTSKGQGPTGT